MERLLSDCEMGWIAPLRRWEGVTVLMDFSMAGTRNLVFQAGGPDHAIRLNFQDWLALVIPGVAFFTEADLACSRVTAGYNRQRDPKTGWCDGITTWSERKELASVS